MGLRKSKAFTLIELLIVVVIIGILAGIVLAVLQPAQQQRRAREAVFQSHTSKVCTALMACAASTTRATLCDTAAELGVDTTAVGIQDKPVAGADYYINPAAATYADATTASDTATIYVNTQMTTVAGECKGTCNYNFGTSVGAPASFTGCIVGN